MQLGNGPITLNPNTLVDLGGPAPLLTLDGLTNPLSGGETVQLVLNFATAGTVKLMVPVEPAAYEFATYSPAPTPSATTPTGTPSQHGRHARRHRHPSSPSASPLA